MLANLSGHNSVIVRQFTQLLNNKLRLYLSLGRLIGHRVRLLPPINLLTPGGQFIDQCLDFGFVFTQFLDQFFQNVLKITDNRQIDPDILLDRGRVDIDMDNFCIRRKGCYLAGNPIVKPCPDGDQQVGIGHRHVGVIGAVHAEHAE